MQTVLWVLNPHLSHTYIHTDIYSVHSGKGQRLEYEAWMVAWCQRYRYTYDFYSVWFWFL